MTSVQRVLLHAPWVAGLAGILATWSYASWLRTTQQRRLTQYVGQPALLCALYCSLLLFSTGQVIVAWILSAQPKWNSAVWMVFFLYFGTLAFRSGKRWVQENRPRAPVQKKQQ